MGRYLDIATQLARMHLAALPKVINGYILSLILDPKAALRFSEQVLENDDLTRPCPILGSRSIHEVFPVEGDVIIQGSYHRCEAAGTNRLTELAALAAAAKFIQPRKIFEFGTHVGRTSRILLINAGESAEIFTLDLPREQCSHESGKYLRDSPEAGRATFLFGDSRFFDFSKWLGQCDLVWVDACHDYDLVRSDTENAFRIVSPGGWILWHDYRLTAGWTGVARCLRELKKSCPSVFHITGTTIAALNVSDDPTAC